MVSPNESVACKVKVWRPGLAASMVWSKAPELSATMVEMTTLFCLTVIKAPGLVKPLNWMRVSPTRSETDRLSALTKPIAEKIRIRAARANLIILYRKSRFSRPF